MKLTEITREDVIENCEKYYNNKQEFFLKTTETKNLLSAYVERYETETEDDYRYYFEHSYHYRFECDFGSNEKDFINIKDKLIEHIYIVQ